MLACKLSLDQKFVSLMGFSFFNQKRKKKKGRRKKKWSFAR
uniref:Uncharacterized protein n=1 Tax=Rhizophora mucronata TaxID=61149 RepID=A0A2P2P0N3_RHIMU